MRFVKFICCWLPSIVSADECTNYCLQEIGEWEMCKDVVCERSRSDVCKNLVKNSIDGRLRVSREDRWDRSFEEHDPRTPPVTCAEARSGFRPSPIPVETLREDLVGQTQTIYLMRQTEYPSFAEDNLDFAVHVRPEGQESFVLVRLVLSAGSGAYMYASDTDWNDVYGGATFAPIPKGTTALNVDPTSIHIHGLGGFFVQRGMTVFRWPSLPVRGTLGHRVLGLLPIGIGSDFAQQFGKFILAPTDDLNKFQLTILPPSTIDSSMCRNGLFSVPGSRVSHGMTIFAQSFFVGNQLIIPTPFRLTFTTDYNMLLPKAIVDSFLQYIAGRGISSRDRIYTDPFGRIASYKCFLERIDEVFPVFKFDVQNTTIHISPKNYIYDKGYNECVFRIKENPDPYADFILMGAPFFGSNVLLVDTSASGSTTLSVCPSIHAPLYPDHTILEPVARIQRLPVTTRNSVEDNTFEDFIIQVRSLGDESSATSLPLKIVFRESSYSGSSSIYCMHNTLAQKTLGQPGYLRGMVESYRSFYVFHDTVAVGVGPQISTSIIVETQKFAFTVTGAIGWINFANNMDIMRTFGSVAFSPSPGSIDLIYNPGANFDATIECVEGRLIEDITSKHDTKWMVGDVKLRFGEYVPGATFDAELSTDGYIVVGGALHKELKDRLPPGAVVKTSPELMFTFHYEYATDCPPYEAFPNLGIDIAGVSHVVRPNDYILRSSTSSACSVRIRPHQLGGKDHIIELGAPFFRSNNVWLSNSNDGPGTVRTCPKKWF